MASGPMLAPLLASTLQRLAIRRAESPKSFDVQSRSSGDCSMPAGDQIQAIAGDRDRDRDKSQNGP
ncbi:hypothetical protein TRIATDRAFT_310642 [Trichoderma atroviride IMI 206040]|uniref:Uncharacterized protein n=1 Tax=Hypocrea atroviridis (strain ATCC 20476 / IMI 206040) TaxID=452589 RepID=G9P3X5_HYPAI|nr:uncharacterized protein TRIATDRAFT_310642 [Trichoderma atroviride IMI 206040]EHK43081.1 hypothetical protein TRIATDRAFT_310642 [Trichoderma atroviride IMI 206040]